MHRLLFSLCFLALPVTASAQAYEAVNKLQVIPLGAQDFEVIEARGEGARGIWCAAADFMVHKRPSDGTNRIFVKTPSGPSVSGVGRKGVVFTSDASNLGVDPQRSYSVTVRQRGVGLPVNHAIQFCKDYQIELNDVLYRLKGN